MNSKLLLITILLTTSQLVNAQSFIEINGKVLNYEDSTVITGAHIYLEKTNLGTITNSDGIFGLTIASKFATYQVRTSCIGYKSQLKDISSFQNTESLTYLVPNTIALDEFVVYSTDAIKEIFKEALKKMKTHHINTPIKLNVFYRELLKQDSNYGRLTDAVMEVYQDNFYANDINNRSVKLIESRVSDDMLQNNLIYEESPSGLINRLRPLNFPPNFIKNYTCAKNVTNIDTSTVYAIYAKPKNGLKTINVEGTFYIRKYDLAFIGYDAKVPKQYLKYFPEREINMKYKGHKRKVKVTVVKELTSSRFFEYQGFWYIRNVSKSITHQISSDDKSIKMLFNMNSQLVVYDLQTENITKPKQRENLNCNKTISPTKPYNKEFWKSFNVLNYTILESEVKNSLEKSRVLNEQFLKKEKH
jgi:hypothetical protein